MEKVGRHKWPTILAIDLCHTIRDENEVIKTRYIQP